MKQSLRRTARTLGLLVLSACGIPDAVGPRTLPSATTLPNASIGRGGGILTIPDHFFAFDVDQNADIGGATGVLSGGAVISNGKLVLNGTTAYEEVTSNLITATGPLTVMLFARELAFPANHVEFISQGQSGSGFYIGRDPIGNMRVSDSWLSTGIPMPSDNLEHHYAITFDPATPLTSLYIDGQLKGTNPGLSRGQIGSLTRFGRQFDPFGEYLNGDLDDIGIFYSVLSAAEVQAYATRNGDVDGDGVVDATDNCRFVQNPAQADFDQDGLGDSCDADPGADLGIRITNRPTPIFNQNFNVNLRESDLGPGASTGATLFIPGSSAFRFVSASNTVCGVVTGGLQCAFGGLAAGGQLNAVLTFKAVKHGTYPYSLTLTGQQTDTKTANNSVSGSVTIP